MRSDGHRIRRGASPFIALAALCLVLACSTEIEGVSTQRTLDALSSAEKTELDDFVKQIRHAHETGNHQWVRDLSDTSRMPPPLVRLNNHGSIPKGPREVTSIRIEPMQLKDGVLLRYEGLDYVYNVEPLGRLVIEINDVSIGVVSIEVTFGRRDGEFRLAGLEPLVAPNPAVP